MLIDKSKSIVDVFRAFNVECRHPFPYPADNTIIFEEWYFNQFIPDNARERVYLPIFWTGYYVRSNFGKDAQAIQHLQGYLNVLDKTKKYYTIVQYDDGILNDLSHLDIRVFSMSGKPIDYPLPLICMPHAFAFSEQKDLLMSFVGRITHPVRQQLIDLYGKRANCYLHASHHSLQQYCQILARSTFALCPRGHGPSSFRIMEAVQYGAIPVYISDDFVLGHNVGFPGILIHTENTEALENLPTILNAALVVNPDMQKHIPWAFRDYFTYDANKRLILENLLHEDPDAQRSKNN
jgi:exostosin family protein